MAPALGFTFARATFHVRFILAGGANGTVDRPNFYRGPILRLRTTHHPMPRQKVNPGNAVTPFFPSSLFIFLWNFYKLPFRFLYCAEVYDKAAYLHLGILSYIRRRRTTYRG